MIWSWIVKVLLWAAAGYLASKLMKDGKPEGWIGNVVIGLIGGLVGSLLFRLIGLKSTGGIIGDILVSTVGACVVIWGVRKISNR